MRQLSRAATIAACCALAGAEERCDSCTECTWLSAKPVQPSVLDYQVTSQVPASVDPLGSGASSSASECRIQ